MFSDNIVVNVLMSVMGDVIVVVFGEVIVVVLVTDIVVAFLVTVSVTVFAVGGDVKIPPKYPHVAPIIVPKPRAIPILVAVESACLRERFLTFLKAIICKI